MTSARLRCILLRTGTTLCLSVAVVLVLSTWWSLLFRVPSEATVAVRSGCVRVFRQVMPTVGLIRHGAGLSGWNEWTLTKGLGGRFAAFPIWSAGVAIVLPVLLFGGVLPKNPRSRWGTWEHRLLICAKWSGTIMCAALLAAWATRPLWNPHSPKSNNPLAYLTALQQDRLSISGVSARSGSPAARGPDLRQGRMSKPQRSAPAIIAGRIAGFLRLIPFWLAIPLVGIPTAILWRLDRRMPSGHCRRCGYNLKGLTEARCPECGQPFETKGDAA